MLKAIFTITGKFYYRATLLIEGVVSRARLKVDSIQPRWSSYFVRKVNPKFQSTIALSRANQQPRLSLQALPSINGFVNLLASILKSGRVTMLRVGSSRTPQAGVVWNKK